MKNLLLLCFLLCCSTLFTQTVQNKSLLSIEQIMQGDKFVGFLPQNFSWSEDSKTIYFSWNPDMDTLRSRYKVSLANGSTPQKLNLEERKSLITNGTYNKAYTKKVFTRNGDLFLLDLTTGREIQVSNTTAREGNPQFAGDEGKVIYISNNNAFVWDINTGATTQLSNFKRGSKRGEPKRAQHEQWLEQDQLNYFDILSQRKATRSLRKDQNESLSPKHPLEIYYGDKQISNIRVSPDLRFVTYRLTKRSKSKATKVPNYVTESGYIQDLNARSKVGTPQDTYEMGVYDRQKDTSYILDTKQIDGIFDKPAFLFEYHQDTTEYNPKYEKPKAVLIHGPFYAEDSKALVVVRSLDNKDRWIMLLDAAKGNLKLLDWQHDEAWVGGPGIVGWNFSPGNIGWFADNNTIYFQSEETGFSHLYKMNVETGEKVALTNGKFEIIDAFLSKDKQHFYITANAEGPHEHHFYKMPAEGGKMEKITSAEGNHQITLSPDEKYLAIRYSYSNKPWELYVMENKPGAVMRQVTNSTTSAFKKYDWRVPEIVWFKASDGAQVPARLYRPKKAKKNGPAVIFVHGAGYLQNVHKWWSSYYREYMFHNILVDNGYTVLDIDYRASNGYGRNWRTAIYRHMGGKDMSDQVDGAKFLVEKYNIDPKNIGIYGGSYGGFITMMAMFTAPGTFKSGAALRSVTDWAHYNHPYTSNILNTPAQDTLAYRRSSPIYHAEGLQGNLLILHGMIDTNVQFQDVVRLAQRLIELGKENWEFAVFPLESHGFVEPSSWTDEYKRIFKLFQTTLK